jgi:hypothetical protein
MGRPGKLLKFYIPQIKSLQTKSVYKSLTMDGVYDPKKGYSVSVTSALNDGLIDTKTEQYHNPITGDRFSLEDATNKGLIDQETYRAITRPFLSDYRTHRQLNLLQAVNSRLVDPKQRTIQVSADKILPFAQAAREGLLPSEVGDRLRRHDKLTVRCSENFYLKVTLSF